VIVALVCAATFAAYVALVRHHDAKLPRRAWSVARTLWCGLGLALLAGALSPALDAAAARSVFTCCSMCC